MTRVRDTESDDERRPAREAPAGRVLRGLGVAPGIALGPAYLYAREEVDVEEGSVRAKEVDRELDRFERAVRRVEKDLAKIVLLTREKLGSESAEVFEAQKLMLRDEALYEAVVVAIREEHCRADYAVRRVMRQHRRRLERSGNGYMRERAHDLADVQDRIVRHLNRSKLVSAITPGTIVIAEQLTAADLILFSRRDILGCITTRGAATSHVAIMARALGLPAVAGVDGVHQQVETGQAVALDGWRGDVVVEPRAAQRRVFDERQAHYRRLRSELNEMSDRPTATVDGHRVTLRANLELPQEIELLDRYGAEGIGLFRTEMLILRRGEAVRSADFNEQVYREVVEAAAPHVTTLRLLDLGGDKLLPRAHREHNPFLGWRGIRVLLDRPEVLRAQLKAALRASVYGPLRLLVPMVSHLDEVLQVAEALEATKAALREAGEAFDEDLPLGVMVEVPAVAMQVGAFAPHVDFLSLGTNDLTQFMLAVDRGNSFVADRYAEMHPAVLRLIGDVVAEGQRHDLGVALCGELATDVKAVPLLLGLGLREFSASPTYLPEIKRVVCNVRADAAQALAQEALALDRASDVEALAAEWLRAHVPDAFHPYGDLVDQ